MIAAGATRDLKWIANLAVGLKTICHGSLIGVGSRDGETMRNLMSIFRYHPLVIRVEYVDGKPAWDKITKIEIVKDHGEVVQSYTPIRPTIT